MTRRDEIKPWLLRKTVLPQNTDHAGIMWHGSYLAWLEEARINALLNVGLAYKQISDEGFELPVVNLEIKYLSPLIHGENVLLKSFVTQGKGPRIRWKTIFLTCSEKKAALATVDLVLIKKDYCGGHIIRKTPVSISNALEDLKSGPKILI